MLERGSACGDNPTLSQQPLFAGPLVTMIDQTCCAPRSGCGPVRVAPVTHIVFIRSGVFVCHDAARPSNSVTGDTAHALLFNAGVPFRVSHPTGRGDISTALAFSDEIVREMVEQIDASHERRRLSASRGPFGSRHALAEPAVLLRLNRLRWRARTSDTLGDALALEEEALSLLAAVLRASFGRLDTNSRRDQQRQRRREIVERVKVALAKAPSASTSLADLATYTGLSPFHLARTFREEVGLPIHQYLLRMRLAEALQRLQDPTTPLGTLALELGFSSPSHFTTAFHRVFGVPPRCCRGAADRAAHGAARFRLA